MRLLIVALSALILSGCVDGGGKETPKKFKDNLTHVKDFRVGDLYRGKSGDCYLIKTNSMTIVKCEDFL